MPGFNSTSTVLMANFFRAERKINSKSNKYLFYGSLHKHGFSGLVKSFQPALRIVGGYAQKLFYKPSQNLRYSNPGFRKVL